MFVLIEVVQESGVGLVPADTDVAGMEHITDLVADQIDDDLEVELLGHALLDAIDDGQLRSALLLGLEQTLRLVEEARVFQRDAHACGDGCKKTDFRLAECVLPLVILQCDRAQRAVATEDRDRDR